MGITAGDLMTSRVITLTPDMTLNEMDSVLVNGGFSGAPVVEMDQLVGVASQADVVRMLWEGQTEASKHPAYYSSRSPFPVTALAYIARDSRQIGDLLVENTVREIMTRHPIVAHPSDPIEDVAYRLVREQIHRLPVTDPVSGVLVGIISSLDLVRAITTFGLKEPVRATRSETSAH